MIMPFLDFRENWRDVETKHYACEIGIESSDPIANATALQVIRDVECYELELIGAFYTQPHEYLG